MTVHFPNSDNTVGLKSNLNGFTKYKLDSEE